MKKILTAALSALLAVPAFGQHFYHRLDVGMGNFYGFALTNAVTGALNGLTNDMLFDCAVAETFMPTSGNGALYDDVKRYKGFGITARDFFNDVTTGARLGYKTTRFSAFNWGVFGSPHYRINQFKTVSSTVDDALVRHNVHRLQVGGGLLFEFGKTDKPTKVIVEAELRYDMPIKYKGLEGLDASDAINSGLSSRYALRINGKGWFQGIGVYAEIPHYNLFDKSNTGALLPQIKAYTIGFIYTVTPWKAKEAYE